MKTFRPTVPPGVAFYAPRLKTSPVLEVSGHHYPEGFTGQSPVIYRYAVESRAAYDEALKRAWSAHPRDAVAAGKLAFDLLHPSAQ